VVCAVRAAGRATVVPQDPSQYSSDRDPDRDPSPWDARWGQPHSQPPGASGTKLARALLALVVAVGLIALAQVFLSGTPLGLVAAVLMVAVLGFFYA